MVVMRWPYVIALLAGCSYNPQGGEVPGVDGNGAGMEAVDAPIIPAVCPMRYDEKFEGHSYFLTGFGNNAEAMADCATDGGHLIKIDSMAEALEAADRIDLLGTPPVWIGLHDVGTGYKWHDNMAPQFEYWQGTPPGSGDPDCVLQSTLDGDGRWSASDCTQNRLGVCECDGP